MCVLEISSKILQKYLWLSSYFIKQQAFSLQLYLKWTPPQVFSRIFPSLFSLETLFAEQLFMAHSWQRVLNTPYVIKIHLYCLLHLFKTLSNPSSPSLLTFTSSAIFDVLFLWLNPWWCIKRDWITLDALWYLIKLWIYSCRVLVP